MRFFKAIHTALSIQLEILLMLIFLVRKFMFVLTTCFGEFGRASVFGEYPTYPEFAFFLQSNCVPDYLPETCEDGQPLTWNRGGEAVKVAVIPGLENGENYIDLSTWADGVGISWENWYVDSGSFITGSTSNPNCDILSVSDFDLKNISVGPNPFRDALIIETDLQKFSLDLYDISGKEVAHFQDQKAISVSFLPSGIYFLKLTSGDIQETFKLIKH